MKNKYNLLYTLLFLLVNQSFALNANNTTTSTATLSKSCSLSVDTASFGNFVPSSSGISSTSSNINVLCTRTTTYTITADGFRRNTCGRREIGLNGSINGADFLLYNIYTDNAYTKMLSYPTCGGVTISGTGTGLVNNHSIYLKMDNNQFVKPGSYSDNTPITVSF